MSHPARLSLRAPPHRPFVAGYPGIPGSSTRPAPALHGTVEVRIGPNPIKARWVRAELRKYESVPPGYPSSSSGETWEHVGEVSTLWSAAPGKEWDSLEQADFKFYIPLPDNIPSSVELAKGTGIRYELVAALCYRQKGGMFKKESAPIMKIVEPIKIVKHELHCAWPLYNTPDTRTVQGSNGEMTMTVQRPSSAFGPTDRFLLTASLRSTRPKPFKLKGFECSLSEITTVMPPPVDPSKSKKGKGPPQPTIKARVIGSARYPLDESLGRGGEKSARIDMAVPTEKILVTVENARMLQIGYELEVKAVCDSGIPEIKVGGFKYVVGPYARAHAQQAVKEIGHFDKLCPGMIPPSQTTSGATTPFTTSYTPSPPPVDLQPNGFTGRQPNQPVQGFVARDERRRKSSDTSTMTTTTTTTYDPANHGQSRPQSMQYKSPNNAVNFPNPHPAPGLKRSGTNKTTDTTYTSLSSQVENIAGEEQYNQGQGHGGDTSKRYSSATAGTFGFWDKNLKGGQAESGGVSPVTPSGSIPSNHMPATPPHVGSTRSRAAPSAWQSAEQEKMGLYNDARTKAAAAQQSTGASLQNLGMDDAVAPPEYAPRLPNMPKQEYRAPDRPVSLYTNRSPVAGSSANRATPMTEDKEPPKAPTNTAEAVVNHTVRSKEGAERRPIAIGSAAGNAPFGSTNQPGSTRQSSADGLVPYDALNTGNSSAGPSNQPAHNSAPASNGGSALSEKEQMRRYYEAQDRVAHARTASLGSPTPASFAASQPTTSAPGSPIDHADPPAQSPPPSAFSEKEQMRRYYEAQNKVVQAGGSSSRAPPPPTQASASRPAQIGLGIGVPSSGLSEKEQMKRFYAAQDRVARAASGEGPSTATNDDPPAFDNPPPSGPSGSSKSRKPPQQYMSAAEEKEMMRKRFEAATAAVDRNRNVSGGASSQLSHDRSASLGPPASPPAPYMSAAEEKEMMRKRFEAATNAVERKRSPARLNNIDSPPRASGSGSGSQAPAYVSATEEKETMRKPFEAATSAVDRNRVASSGSYTGVDSPSRAGPSRGFMASAEEKEAMRRRFEAATAAVERKRGGTTSPSPTKSQFSNPPDSPLFRDPTVKAGKARAMTAAPTGPPPPLPTKPPKEYINLLSPTTENGPSLARFGAVGPNGMVPLASVLDGEAAGKSAGGSRS